MFDRVKILKDKGYNPDAILDIGAHKGWWTNRMRYIYPDPTYYLFEPTNYTELQQFNNDNNVKIFNVLLHDKIEEVDWFQINGTGDSIYKEKTFHYFGCEPIKRQAVDLDSIILQNGILNDAKNILIKIDCQGSEIPILKGSRNILHKTDFIILEVPFFGEFNLNTPNFLEHISFMDSIGFSAFDILEKHYLAEFNIQLDILFINKNHEFNNVVSQVLLKH